MARTAKHSKPELRDMALEAARAIIAEEGTRNITVRAVATRMGYSVGTIYNIFEGLEDLIAALNAETLDALHGVLARVPVTGKPETDLHALLDGYLEFVTAHRRNWKIKKFIIYVQHGPSRISENNIHALESKRLK